MLGNASRRMFNSKFDRKLEDLLNRLPQGNIGYALVGLNVGFYGLRLIWPQHNMFSFYNNFTFSMFGLQRGHIWNMLTCHFTHMSFFNFLLDSVIIFLISQNLTMMYGNLFVAKTVLLSIMLGSMFLFA
jgi:membrane associated rhomboid family serine protease